MREKVALCWVDPGNVSGRFMASVMDAMYVSEEGYGPKIVGHVRVESGPRIATARNALVRQFLKKEEWKDAEWLLMMDADMTFNPTAIARIFDGVRNENGQITQPIVGGLCFGGGHSTIVPTMYRIVDPSTNNGEAVEFITDFEDGELVEVDATGAAFILIHRGVLEQMSLAHEDPAPWFAESIYLGREFGEDWTFCIRARSMGLPIYVNTAVKIGHLKSIEMNEAMWRTGKAGLVSLAVAPDRPVLDVATSKLIIPGQTPNRAQRRARV